MTPSEKVVETITPLLEAKNLLLPSDATRFKSKIAAGEMKTEDWLLAVEKAIEKESKK